MSRNVPDFLFWSSFAVAFAIASIAGFWAGDAASRDKVDQIDRRQQIEDACIAGNGNACLVFQAKHGKCAR